MVSPLKLMLPRSATVTIFGAEPKIICAEDWRSNNEAALHGERVMAVYNIPEDMESEFEEHLWIITEWDRSATTLLFPSDY